MSRHRQDKIKDNHVSILANIANEIKNQYIRDKHNDPWVNSPFGWIRTCSSRRIGKIGEQLVAEWCKTNGLSVSPCRDSQADLIIAELRVEIKFSTLWASGIYKFQQIRDQNYHYVVCLGISPFNAHCWVISKDVLHDHVIGHTPQHTGRSGTDTFWFSVDPLAPPEWLKECGGSLAVALDIMKGW